MEAKFISRAASAWFLLLPKDRQIKRTSHSCVIFGSLGLSSHLSILRFFIGVRQGKFRDSTFKQAATTSYQILPTL